MDGFFTPSPALRLSGSAAAMSPSEEEEVLRPGTSSQGDSQPAQDNVPMDCLPLIFQHIKSYFGPCKTNGKVKCKLCNKEIAYSATSNYNIKSHYERQHRGEYPNLVAALNAGSKRGRYSSYGGSGARPPALKKRRSSIEPAFKEKFDQIKALKLYYSFFIKDIVPAHLTDSHALREFMNYVKPDFNVPSRRKLTRDIAQLGEEAKDAISNLLANVRYVATTADSWSAHNRSFLGITVHWIDPTSLKREKGVLGIKEIAVQQRDTYLARAMMDDLHQEFGLSNKVVSTTTDNGKNYVAAFQMFAGNVEEDDEEVAQEPVQEEGEDVVMAVIVGDALKEEMDDDVRELPKHHHCGAHTVNLMATTDVSKVPGWNSGRRPPFTKTAAKAQALWNCQNRRTVVANQIKEAIGKKLQTPGVTHWNSYYESCAGLLEVLEDPEKKDQLNVVSRKQGLSAFYEGDRDLLAQYCKIMKPVAICLDILQSEENAYMGILLPNLKLMKDQVAALRTDASIVEGQELINYLLENHDNPRVAFKGRFEHLFQDMDLLMATALHPHFKLGVVGHLSEGLKDNIRRRVIREVMSKVASDEEVGDAQVQPEMEDDPFIYMRGDDSQPAATPGRLQEDLENTYEGWNKVRVKSTTPLSLDKFPLHQREAWLDLFIRYNSPLPSSAALERLFRIGSDILRPKSSSLTADNFEKLVFVKGNLHLLKGKKWLSQMEMEEEEENV